MTEMEHGSRLVAMERIQNGIRNSGDRSVHMVNDAVFDSRTGVRTVLAPVHMSMFDGLPNIGERRARTLPNRTPRIRTRSE